MSGPILYWLPCKYTVSLCFLECISQRDSKRIFSSLRRWHGGSEGGEYCRHFLSYKRLIVLHAKRIEVSKRELPEHQNRLALESRKLAFALRCSRRPGITSSLRRGKKR